MASFVVGAIFGAGSLWLVGDTTEPMVSVAQSPHSSAPVTKPSETPTLTTYDPNLVTIEYAVTTDGMSVTHLSYVDIVDGAPVMMENLGSPPPFAHVIQLPKNEGFDLEKLSVTAMGAATSTTTMCTLKVDGEVVARQSADGVYGLVNCAVSDGADSA
jgi:hypothetical protein